MKNTYKWLFVSLVLLCTVNSYAQNSFRYQAVARDSFGDGIANQLIGVQISIILDDIANSPIYQEMHQPTSNDYGVLNLNVGDGVPLVGDFASIDWSQTAFIKVELDVTGGTNYTIESTSEILSVPRALYAENAKYLDGNQFGLLVTNFGAKSDGNTDDTGAFQAALDSANIVGAKVFVPKGIYRITQTLLLEDGVSLIGEGQGSDPLQTPYNGSLLRYEGDGYALQVSGHNVNVRDLVVRDNGGSQSDGGVQVLADGRLLEGVNFFDVLLSGFVDGTGIDLRAINSGGIAYATFNHVRVRHGKIGIHLSQDNSGSFVNSNGWYQCQISGGGFDYGLLVDGGNNNVFQGLIIEPPTTNNGHLVVNDGKILGYEIRIEGNNQSQTVPLIYFDRKTRNSIITGVYAGGLTLDKGNNLVDMLSGKAIHYKNSSFNKFRNANFFTSDGTVIKDWVITGNAVGVQVTDPELSEVHNILKLTVPAGVTAILEPEVFARPEVKDLPLYDQVNFGFHVKTDKSNMVYTATNALKGWTSSTPHTGSSDWEFVSMNAEVNRSQPSRFTLQINNTSGSTMTVYITTPTLNFGNQLPTLDEAPLFTSGGVLMGQLTHAVATIITPNNGYLALPLTANYFEITNSTNIHRINHLTKDRVPKGTIITLLFNNAGISVTNSGYLNLKGGFTSVINGSLTLMSNGNGTWREVDRNN
jgi:hypothetical protein